MRSSSNDLLASCVLTSLIRSASALDWFVCSHDARADIHSRYTKIDRPGLQILVSDTAKAKHRPMPTVTPGPNCAARSDLGAFVHSNRACDEIECGSRPVVATGARIDPLRDTAIRSDRGGSDNFVPASVPRCYGACVRRDRFVPRAVTKRCPILAFPSRFGERD